MTTQTVATRLQDASLLLWLDPYMDPEPTYDLDGSRIVFNRKHMTDDHDSLVNTMFMVRITVDGLATQRQGGYGYYLFNTRDTGDCGSTDPEGYCDCYPTEYKPVSYRSGEICEACWIEVGMVFGIGKEYCIHEA